jgi:hypothetical protein
MRTVLTKVLALGLSIGMFASAQAATVHHTKARHGTVIHHGRDPLRSFAAPAPTIDPLHPPVLEDQTPSYDDPSRFGGG